MNPKFDDRQKKEFVKITIYRENWYALVLAITQEISANAALETMGIITKERDPNSTRLRQGKRVELDLQQIMEYQKQGWSIVRIADEKNCSYNTIIRFMQKEGIYKPRRKGAHK